MALRERRNSSSFCFPILNDQSSLLAPNCDLSTRVRFIHFPFTRSLSSLIVCVSARASRIHLPLSDASASISRSSCGTCNTHTFSHSYAHTHTHCQPDWFAFFCPLLPLAMQLVSVTSSTSILLVRSLHVNMHRLLLFEMINNQDAKSRH